jgi:prophage regulatory protein
MSTIDRLEQHENDFPKRFWLTDKRCTWNADEVEHGWILVRPTAQKDSPVKNHQ